MFFFCNFENNLDKIVNAITHTLDDTADIVMIQNKLNKYL